MFWDSSAIMPLLLAEDHSSRLVELLKADRPFIWWSSSVECLSGVYRRHREHGLSTTVLRSTLQRLEEFVRNADVIAPTAEVKNRAARLLAVHPLRAGDALQLAAALVGCEERPSGEGFVCLDRRLGQAAFREGFSVHGQADFNK